MKNEPVTFAPVVHQDGGKGEEFKHGGILRANAGEYDIQEDALQARSV